jgi:hypothetical protein
MVGLLMTANLFGAGGNVTGRVERDEVYDSVQVGAR